MKKGIPSCTAVNYWKGWRKIAKTGGRMRISREKPRNIHLRGFTMLCCSAPWAITPGLYKQTAVLIGNNRLKPCFKTNQKSGVIMNIWYIQISSCYIRWILFSDMILLFFGHANRSYSIFTICIFTTLVNIQTSFDKEEVKCLTIIDDIVKFKSADQSECGGRINFHGFTG